MKQFAISVAATVVGVFLLLVVATIGLVGFEYWNGQNLQTREDPSFVKNPPGIRISQHNQVAGVDRFTVQGIAENYGTRTWYAVNIVSSVFSGGAKVNGCEGTIYGKLAPNARRAFQIECSDTSSKLPQPVSYTLSIRNARKGEG